MRSNVDLPLPFGPMTVRTSPSRSSSAGHVEYGRAAVRHLHAAELDDGGRRHVGRTWIEPRWIENSQ